MLNVLMPTLLKIILLVRHMRSALTLNSVDSTYAACFVEKVCGALVYWGGFSRGG